MCERLGQLRQALADYSEGFDAELLSVADARVVVADITAMEHMAATLKALAALRAARVGPSGESGLRVAAQALASVTGTTVGVANQTLQLGRRLSNQPDVVLAARRGQLSPTQAAVIADAAEVNPSAAAVLVDQAVSGFGLVELRDACAAVKAAARPDPEAHRRQIHQHRRLRSWTDTDGVWHLSGCANPETGAQIDAAIAPITDALFHQARRQRRREHPQAYALDALVQLATQTAGSDPTGPDSEPPDPTAGAPDPATATAKPRRRGAAVKLLMRVDYDTFLRGGGGGR